MTQATLPKQRKLSWIGWLGVVLLVGSGWWAYGRWFSDRAFLVSAQIDTIARGTVEDPITQTGIIKLAQQRPLKSLAEGRVKEVYVDLGDRITTGQLLLLLEDDNWETERLRHQLNVRQHDIAIKLQLQAISTAEASLADVKKQLAIDEQLLAQGYVAGEDVEQTKQSVREAEAGLQGAYLQLEQTQLEGQELQIKARELEQDLQSKQVFSPGPAVILDMLVHQGDVVQTGDKLMMLGNPGRELVYLQLSPLRAQQVQPLQSARIKPLGPDAKTYNGQVKEIALLAGNEDSPHSSRGQSDLEVVVELDTPSGTLIPGTQVSVDIVLDQREDVVKVAAGAIQQSEEGPFVWILGADSTAQRQPVSIGLEGLTEVEITKGLETGDEIIVLPDSVLEEGITVQAQ
ncbi:MAG: efflux RND transporter periplasmic adaptor subunit [Cyanobacteria bacterium P01_F01_bin.150]